LPAFTIIVALTVAIKGRLAAVSGAVALFILGAVFMTGERINFLITACGGMLAGLVWKPRPVRYLGIVLIGLLAAAAVTVVPTQSRFVEIIDDAKFSYDQEHFRTLMGGIEAFKISPAVGIGPGNYRFLSPEILADFPQLKPDNHPHNYYIQLLAETGVIGLALGTVFLFSIIWTCFRASFKNRKNVFIATAWVVPFGLFWPLATSADFFGQWNNIFMWSAVALAVNAVDFK
jgi:O-antigen ligase